MPINAYPTSRPRAAVPRLTALLMAGSAIAGWVPGTGAASPATDAPAASAATVPAGSVVAIGGALRYDNCGRLVAPRGARGRHRVPLRRVRNRGSRIRRARLRAPRPRSKPTAPGSSTFRLRRSLPGVDVAQAVRDPALLARVRAARGVFFTGGAQERIVDTLQPGGHPTPMLEAIREVLDAGAWWRAHRQVPRS